ncbi:hypothetical protein HYPSUDRAFT_205612 [Hypholoma sublateritium FD-334 SS-4]|uniref:Uncharacterized protein n=1 Tax=Hypholoma sublateritium (strain FD-334 SS-4) TaxID=945553 RepID=A0A0D2NGM7_HYPSF|nr:hypothetical protein HYPSUDRAFT_205612 [Hypholoma sublateritium FD-334 SS-4]
MLLEYFNDFYNEAGGPTEKDNSPNQQRRWLEKQVRDDLPGGSGEAVDMFELYSCLLDETYIKNTVALTEGSMWTERFSATLIQETIDRKHTIQEKLRMLAHGHLAAYLLSAPEPSQESYSKPADAPAALIPNTSTTTGTRTIDLAVSLESQFDADTDVSDNATQSLEQALAEKFKAEGIATRGRLLLRQIRTSTHTLIDAGELNFGGKNFPRPFGTPLPTVIHNATDLLNIIGSRDGHDVGIPDSGRKFEGLCALLKSSVILHLTSEFINQAGVVAFARGLEEYSDRGLEIPHHVFSLAATMVRSS